MDADRADRDRGEHKAGKGETNSYPHTLSNLRHWRHRSFRSFVTACSFRKTCFHLSGQARRRVFPGPALAPSIRSFVQRFRSLGTPIRLISQASSTPELFLTR